MRGPVAPPQVPLSVSRAESFDDLVRDSAERLEHHWPQLSRVNFAVQEVPPAADGHDAAPPAAEAGTAAAEAEGRVPLGRVITARGDRPDTVIVYRRPVEIRSRNREERALLVHEVVVEQVAELMGLDPELVDPRYGRD